MLRADIPEKLARFRIHEGLGLIAAQGHKGKMTGQAYPSPLDFNSCFEVSISAQEAGQFAE